VTPVEKSMRYAYEANWPGDMYQGPTVTAPIAVAGFCSDVCVMNGPIVDVSGWPGNLHKLYRPESSLSLSLYRQRFS